MKHVKKVLIIQAEVKQYRVSFYEKLFTVLKEKGIDLIVAYSAPNSLQKMKGDNVELDSRIGRNVKGYWFINNKIMFQNVITLIAQADLIIVEQANKYIVNYLLLIIAMLRLKKIAYWGHGRNMQAEGKNRFREYFKKKLTTMVDWWFAYTKISSHHVASLGFPKEKITIIQNTIDTKELDKDLSSVNEQGIKELKKSMNINSENICIYCGGIYRDKKIEFLLESSIDIRKYIKDFHLIIIGSGPLDYIIKEVSKRHSWIHYLGPVMGMAKAPYFRMSKAILMPGLVGLAIVDSFVAGMPLITTDLKIHSPEISYLENGKNGIMTSFSKEDYVKSVVNYLRSEELQEILRAGCLRSADKYSMDNMVNNFKNGIINCLFRVN